MVRMLSQIGSRSDKQVELWQRGAGEKRDTSTCLENDGPGVTMVNTEVLLALQNISGSITTITMMILTVVLVPNPTTIRSSINFYSFEFL